ncbi:ornithine cyclodeaminase (plasmid) [Burkholderia sp. SFA1]|nr:ornithine cyclodeaminase [Burkholderia sp. SFA1]
MLVLNKSDVAHALTMADCIDAIETALADNARGQYRQFPRVVLRAEDTPAMMGLMPVFRRGERPLWAMKDIMVSSANHALGLDTHQGAVLIHDGITGVITAMVDANEITATRTAATSAVATRALAGKDLQRIAILGTGRQARAHIDALRVLAPGAKFTVWGIDAEQASRLAKASDCEVCPSAQAAVSDADVICTVTASQTPILELDWIKEGCHINAVGASAPTSRELAADVFCSAECFVDSRSQAEAECGEYLIPLDEGLITADHILAELGEVLIGEHLGRSGPRALTVFKSLGLPMEDLAASVRAIENAQRLGVGQLVLW